MKSLKYYLEELATPLDTMGMGNPDVSGEIMSEPLVDKKRRRSKKSPKCMINKKNIILQES